MAPSRRKGANKAAAAAAARRKWKVGDLVLAKVKGFPAWPATVSEPEKWGYTADWKKVVVHFFGTEQIAFCNPGDVEEFTEEKKVSLLGRRHGKGADFVRAVTEIIDCFEKLKKQHQVTKVNDTEGTNIANDNIDGSLTESVRDDDLVETVKQLSTGTTNDLNSLTEVALAAAAEDALHDKEMQVDKSPSYLTTNKSDVARPKKSGSRRRKSARVLRSSSRIGATRPQITMMLSTVNTRSSRRSSANASEHRSLRRTKRIVKSSDDCVRKDVDSLAFVSSDSTEESDSRIMTVDSDTLSTNDGSNSDSGCKPVVLEQPFTENTEGELSDRLDFPSNGAVINKKRKPNRKGHSNDIVEAANHDVVASDAGMLKNASVSPTFSEKSAQKYARDDSDQHLPLVKRARVRMGMLSPTAVEEVTLVHKEEIMSEVPGGLVTESSEPLRFQVDCADTEFVAARKDLTLSSQSHASLAKPILSETWKNYVDEEAALPPSKRIHRALKAMSANVAEDCERTSDCSAAAKIQSNGHRLSFLESSELSLGKRAKVEMESESTENLRNGDSLVIAEDKTVSVIQSSSSLTSGTDGARVSLPSSSICNLAAVDNTPEHNSSSSPDVQSHLEKAKLAGKCTSKGESLSSFEAIIRSLTRTKETIGRATRIAIDCAKLGFATKVVEILAQNLESESSLHKKVDLFFLVDSITQCSRGIKGDGGVYPSAIQAILRRLLLAAAPPGSSSHENRRQCLKVLRVWQERKILPESIIRHHIRELDVLCGTGSYPTVGSQRPLRNERAFDDPVREMGSMLVDEYGSNSSIKLVGFCMPRMQRGVDGGSKSDGEGYEAVTPERSVENHEGENTLVPAVEKRSHILEDVDCELEMEDVAPCYEKEIASTSNIAGADQTMLNHQPDNHCGPPITPQQPKDVALTSSLSSSIVPPPHAHSLHTLAGSVLNGTESKPYSSCQEFNSNFEVNRSNQTVSPRVKPTATDNVHQRVRENKNFESQRHRQMPPSKIPWFYSDQPTSQISGRASYSNHRTDSLKKGFRLQPPHPAPSDQFSYVHDQKIQSRRDVPHSSHSNRFQARTTENGNFYKDRGRNKFVPNDNIGECWRPPFPSISGPCYLDDARMGRSPMSYSGPLREPQYPNHRWDFPPRPMNYRHFNYRPSCQGPVPVANRGKVSLSPYERSDTALKCSHPS